MRESTFGFTPQRRKGRRLLAVALAASGLLACHRDEITHVRVPKEAPARPEAAAAEASAPATGALKWTLPAGWNERPGEGMRIASFAPPLGRVDGSIVALPGDAGGELANVNRWRSQIGLAPLDEQALAAARTTLIAAVGELAVFDFASEGPAPRRVIAAQVRGGGATWFVKLAGDAEPVGAAREEFLSLLKGLRFE